MTLSKLLEPNVLSSVRNGPEFLLRSNPQWQEAPAWGLRCCQGWFSHVLTNPFTYFFHNHFVCLMGVFDKDMKDQDGLIHHLRSIVFVVVCDYGEDQINISWATYAENQEIENSFISSIVHLLFLATVDYFSNITPHYSLKLGNSLNLLFK